jgi:hypothetical protein
MNNEGRVLAWVRFDALRDLNVTMSGDIIDINIISSLIHGLFQIILIRLDLL